jgi:hypothetical protein
VISNVHIYYPSQIDPTTGDLSAQTVLWYDLRSVVSAVVGRPVGTSVTATVKPIVAGLTFEPQYSAMIWPQTEFETAKLASLAAEAATGD